MSPPSKYKEKIGTQSANFFKKVLPPILCVLSNFVRYYSTPLHKCPKFVSPHIFWVIHLPPIFWSTFSISLKFSKMVYTAPKILVIEVAPPPLSHTTPLRMFLANSLSNYGVFYSVMLFSELFRSEGVMQVYANVIFTMKIRVRKK